MLSLTLFLSFSSLACTLFPNVTHTFLSVSKIMHGKYGIGMFVFCHDSDLHNIHCVSVRCSANGHISREKHMR